MAFYSRKMISLIHGIQNSSRPFDEILYSYDYSSSTNTDQQCLSGTSTKDRLT